MVRVTGKQKKYYGGYIITGVSDTEKLVIYLLPSMPSNIFYGYLNQKKTFESLVSDWNLKSDTEKNSFVKLEIHVPFVALQNMCLRLPLKMK